MGFLGIVIACASTDIASCGITSSSFLFPDLEMCQYQADNIAKSYSTNGMYAFWHCAQVDEEEQGEML
jgi:hypothetical protein